MCKVMSAPVTLGPRESWRILKNIFVASIAFMVHFTAFHGAFNLQSSINADDGMGTASMAAMYGGVLVSSFFIPVVLIKWLGAKWVLPFCYVAYMPYLIAQLWPTFYTLIPAGVLAGLSSAPLWCAICTYIATVSVISTGGNKAAVTSMNASLIPELCGANFLPSADAGKALQHQPPEKIELLVGIYLVLMVMAMIIIAVGLDSPRRYKSSNDESSESGLSLLVVTLKLIVEPKQLLLAVISIFVGLQQAFVVADLTAAYVACAIGPGTVGYFMLTYGLADAFGCAITSYLAKLTGRVKLILCAVTVNSALFVLLLTWRPQPDVLYVHYVIAVISGICNSVWLVQINAYYGIIFPGREEPAFATFRLFESIGFTIIYSASSYFRTYFKVYLLFTAMTVGSIGYCTVEYIQRRSKGNFIVTKDCISKSCDNKAFNNLE